MNELGGAVCAVYALACGATLLPGDQPRALTVPASPSFTLGSLMPGYTHDNHDYEQGAPAEFNRRLGQNTTTASILRVLCVVVTPRPVFLSV